eukprot:TRINITY_DN7276_c2_g1_i3.p2 TRINITY_DN7276_c2_g1~~TRINITY_DN7276_c2_g1_i3.p2  ORF type:complete len:619 (+),score=175.58 TRINITY_DN7276_c2_g1_i3:67-1857(+)
MAGERCGEAWSSPLVPLLLIAALYPVAHWVPGYVGRLRLRLRGRLKAEAPLSGTTPAPGAPAAAPAAPAAAGTGPAAAPAAAPEPPPEPRRAVPQAPLVSSVAGCPPWHPGALGRPPAEAASAGEGALAALSDGLCAPGLRIAERPLSDSPLPRPAGTAELQPLPAAAPLALFEAAPSRPACWAEHGSCSSCCDGCTRWSHGRRRAGSRGQRAAEQALLRAAWGVTAAAAVLPGGGLRLWAPPGGSPDAARRLGAALSLWGVAVTVCATPGSCGNTTAPSAGLLVGLPIAPKAAASLRLNAAHWIAEVLLPVQRAVAAQAPPGGGRRAAVFAAVRGHPGPPDWGLPHAYPDSAGLPWLRELAALPPPAVEPRAGAGEWRITTVCPVVCPAQYALAAASGALRPWLRSVYAVPLSAPPAPPPNPQLVIATRREGGTRHIANAAELARAAEGAGWSSPVPLLPLWQRCGHAGAAPAQLARADAVAGFHGADLACAVVLMRRGGVLLEVTAETYGNLSWFVRAGVAAGLWVLRWRVPRALVAYPTAPQGFDDRWVRGVWRSHPSSVTLPLAPWLELLAAARALAAAAPPEGSWAPRAPR